MVAVVSRKCILQYIFQSLHFVVEQRGTRYNYVIVYMVIINEMVKLSAGVNVRL